MISLLMVIVRIWHLRRTGDDPEHERSSDLRLRALWQELNEFERLPRRETHGRPDH